MTEQTDNIRRVTEAISKHVTAFVSTHTEWHVETLRQYVFDRVDGYVAPSSPDRILRSLRQQGVIDYEVISRRKSLYRTIGRNEQLELF